jgi:hypothetical protein
VKSSTSKFSFSLVAAKDFNAANDVGSAPAPIAGSTGIVPILQLDFATATTAVPEVRFTASLRTIRHIRACVSPQQDARRRTQREACERHSLVDRKARVCAARTSCSQRKGVQLSSAVAP